MLRVFRHGKLKFEILTLLYERGQHIGAQDQIALRRGDREVDGVGIHILALEFVFLVVFLILFFVHGVAVLVIDHVPGPGHQPEVARPVIAYIVGIGIAAAGIIPLVVGIVVEYLNVVRAGGVGGNGALFAGLKRHALCAAVGQERNLALGRFGGRLDLQSDGHGVGIVIALRGRGARNPIHARLDAQRGEFQYEGPVGLIEAQPAEGELVHGIVVVIVLQIDPVILAGMAVLGLGHGEHDSHRFAAGDRGAVRHNGKAAELAHAGHLDVEHIGVIPFFIDQNLCVDGVQSRLAKADVLVVRAVVLRIVLVAKAIAVEQAHRFDTQGAFFAVLYAHDQRNIDVRADGGSSLDGLRERLVVHHDLHRGNLPAQHGNIDLHLGLVVAISKGAGANLDDVTGLDAILDVFPHEAAPCDGLAHVVGVQIAFHPEQVIHILVPHGGDELNALGVFRERDPVFAGQVLSLF